MYLNQRVSSQSNGKGHDPLINFGSMIQSGILPPASVSRSRSLHLFLSISIWLCVYVCVQTKLMKNEYKRWLKEERQSLTPKPENLT